MSSTAAHLLASLASKLSTLKGPANIAAAVTSFQTASTFTRNTAKLAAVQRKITDAEAEIKLLIQGCMPLIMKIFGDAAHNLAVVSAGCEWILTLRNAAAIIDWTRNVMVGKLQATPEAMEKRLPYAAVKSLKDHFEMATPCLDFLAARWWETAPLVWPVMAQVIVKLRAGFAPSGPIPPELLGHIRTTFNALSCMTHHINTDNNDPIALAASHSFLDNGGVVALADLLGENTANVSAIGSEAVSGAFGFIGMLPVYNPTRYLFLSKHIMTSLVACATRFNERDSIYIVLNTAVGFISWHNDPKSVEACRPSLARLLRFGVDALVAHTSDTDMALIAVKLCSHVLIYNDASAVPATVVTAEALKALITLLKRENRWHAAVESIAGLLSNMAGCGPKLVSAGLVTPFLEAVKLHQSDASFNFAHQVSTTVLHFLEEEGLAERLLDAGVLDVIFGIACVRDALQAEPVYPSLEIVGVVDASNVRQTMRGFFSNVSQVMMRLLRVINDKMPRARARRLLHADVAYLLIALHRYHFSDPAPSSISWWPMIAASLLNNVANGDASEFAEITGIAMYVSCLRRQTKNTSFVLAGWNLFSEWAALSITSFTADEFADWMHKFTNAGGLELIRDTISGAYSVSVRSAEHDKRISCLIEIMNAPMMTMCKSYHGRLLMMSGDVPLKALLWIIRTAPSTRQSPVVPERVAILCQLAGHGRHFVVELVKAGCILDVLAFLRQWKTARSSESDESQVTTDINRLLARLLAVKIVVMVPVATGTRKGVK